MEGNTADFERLIESGMSESAKNEIRRRIKLRRKKAVTLIEELSVRTQKIQPLMKKMEQIAKKLKDQRDQFEQNEQNIKQQELQQQQQQFEQNLQMQDQVRQDEQAFESSENELDRINKKEVALINQFAKGNDPLAPTSPDGQPEVLEYSRLAADQAQFSDSHNLEVRKLQQQQKEHSDKMSIEQQRLAAEKERTKSDLQQAKIKLREARIKKADKPKPPKKKK